jgi:hypothetical protein
VVGADGRRVVGGQIPIDDDVPIDDTNKTCKDKYVKKSEIDCGTSPTNCQEEKIETSCGTQIKLEKKDDGDISARNVATATHCAVCGLKPGGGAVAICGKAGGEFNTYLKCKKQIDIIPPAGRPR